MAKTFDQVISEMISVVNNNLGNQDTRTGTVLREGFLAPVATELSDAYSNIDQVEANQNIAAPDAISTAAMDSLAANFGVTRSTGTPSSGVVWFQRFQAPVYPITIPSNTKISVAGSGSSLSFSTLGSATLSALSPQDPVTGAYYVAVPVRCDIPGSVGNVAAGAISYHGVPNVDEVINPNDMTGGTDTQSNSQVASIISARAQGNLGTSSGYEALISSNFPIADMAIVGPTDPEASRAQFGGELDISILDSTYIQSQESIASNQTIFYPSYMPLTSVDYIVGLDTTDTQQTLVPGTDYDVVIDTYSPLARSQKEKSRINIHVTSFSVKPNSVFTVLYRNSQLVRIIQAFIQDPQYATVGADPLVKLANQKLVNVAATISVSPGYDATVVQQNATDSVTAYMNSLLLGDDAYESDIIVAMSVEGVSYVDTTTFQMALADAPLVYLENILVDRLSYLRPGAITLTAI